jgi:hypothetical protein
MFEYLLDNGINQDTFLPEPFNDFNCLVRWRDVVRLLAAYSQKSYSQKSDAPLFCPTTFRYNRGEEQATSSAMMVLDVDDDHVSLDERLSFDAARDALTGYTAAVLYTTASNRDGYRFRIVIPVSEHLTPAQHKRIVIAVCDRMRPGWRPDPSKMNCYSMFYVPGQYAGADNRFVHLKGEIHEPRYWCADYDVEPAMPPAMPAPVRTATPSREVEWRFDFVEEQTNRYLSAGHARNNALFSLMISAAMSARHRGYDLSDSELADWAMGIQATNPGKHTRDRRNMLRSAADAIDIAASRVTDPVIEHFESYAVSDNKSGKLHATPEWMAWMMSGEDEGVSDEIIVPPPFEDYAIKE